MANQILEHPINRDNEALLVANAIASEENRETFLRRTSYDKFRVKEFRTIAWGIFESANSGMDTNIDAILLKSKTCPDKYPVDFNFIQQLTVNFPVVPLANFLEHLEQLSVDKVKEQLLDWTLNSVLPCCTNPTTKLIDIEKRITYGKAILEKGYSASKLGFKTMAEITAEYDLMKSQSIGKRTTGFEEIDKHLTEGFKEGQITTIAGLSSQGKCERKGTLIMMFDCSFKKIEDIKKNDLLMGPDSKSRTVLSITNGYGDMYKVHQRRGEDYYVNENHILSLQHAGAATRTRVGANKIGKKIAAGWKKNGEIINISIKDAIKQSGNFFNKYRGYKASLEFEEKKVLIDPHFLGIWLACGNSTSTAITKPDGEIREYLKSDANTLNMCYHEDNVKSRPNCPNCRISSGRKGGKNLGKNKLVLFLEQYNLIQNKHIPKEYLYNNKEVRMQLLAGLLDGDGHMFDGIHEILTKYDQLKEDILFLARSLGFYCSVNYEEKGIKSINFKGMYWRIRICGYNYLIPNKVKRKKAYKHNKKHLPSQSTIEISYYEKDNYYGFELDGDGLYLHHDFTVTHNSSLALSMMKNLSHWGAGPVHTAQFALEMNATSLYSKLLSFQTRLALDIVVRKPSDLSDSERALYEHEKEILSRNAFMLINDKPKQSVATMREQIMLLQDFIKQQYIVIVVDLFGKIDDLQSSDNFARDYEKVLNKVQVVTRDLGVHTILVAQINKEVGKRSGKRPTMNDMKNSGALTEVSDIIMGIHRPYYDQEAEYRNQITYDLSDDPDNPVDIEEDLDKDIAEVLLLKQRMGPKDIAVNLKFDPITTCFYPLSDQEQRRINQRKLDDHE